MTNPTIKLKSNDDVVYDVDVRVAERSQTIKTMLEDLGMDDCDDPVPLPNVNSAILKKVIEWATHHKDDPPSADDDHSTEKRTDDISEWDTDFLKVDQGTLFELILAANYLDIKGLLDVTCKTVANMIKGKTPEEIREKFQLVKKKDTDQKLMSDDQKLIADNQKLMSDNQKSEIEIVSETDVVLEQIGKMVEYGDFINHK